MNRKLLAIAVSAAVLSLSTVTLVNAAGTSEKGTKAQSRMQQSAAPDPKSNYVASEMIGKDIHNRQGQKVGKLETVLFNRSGDITYGVVNQGGILGLGEDSYAVPWDRFNITANNELQLDVGQKEVSSEFSAFEIKEFKEQTKQRQQMESPSEPEM